LTNEITKQRRTRRARRVTWAGLIWNVFLTILKFIVGIYSRSHALVADAVHSLTDFASDISVLVGLKIADKPVDLTHNYGHGKFETLATIFVGISLFVVGIGLLWNGVTTIYDYLNGQILVQPGSSALVALIASIIVKEGLFHYTIKTGKVLHSQVLIANAWHHRSDALTSIAVLIGVTGAILLGDQWVVLDPIAAVVVSVFILKVAFETGKSSVNELMEVSLSEERRIEILRIVSEIPGVSIPHNLKTRKIGNTVAIDMHIKVDKNLGIVEAHDISTQVEDKLKDSFGEEVLVSIHVEPLLDEGSSNLSFTR